ncbi:unnamed protein product [Leptidea sinapis]|uniref:Uncharacterized protein n=1 Tax=Leptidea sinapis TaxID=189913 RepID=A0A5E4Q3M8_9NEOP|nr:unnamed protein product [Leptidea sinapis]
MDEVGLIQVCLSGFKESDIESAKLVLLEATKQRITRKREGDQKKTLKEIVRILKETDPEDLPIFVAKDLHRLPPVTFDHVDATALLKDLLILKQDVNTIKTTYVTSSDLDEFKTQFQSNNLNENQKLRVCWIIGWCNAHICNYPIIYTWDSVNG